jgi:arsenite methyltransferase
MAKLGVYDPPMCCSTGVCGPAVDLVLPRVAADLDWLKRQGITVERYNLAQQPAAFVSNAAVTGALREYGNECLPLVMVDEQVAVRGRYPERAELARLAGLDDAAREAPAASPGACCSAASPPPVVTIGGTSGGPPPSCC